MKTWQDKAHQIIAQECSAAYRAANQKRDGTWRKKHVPYHVPPIAQALVECLNTDDEVRAKSIFIGLACGDVCEFTV
jgi:hypothetical protein